MNKDINLAAQYLASYQASLDAYFTQYDEAEESLCQWLTQTFKYNNLSALLQAIVADDAILADVAARSYQHGNGFLKVVLLEQAYKLRLHIWFAGQACEENIHDHRWSFASLILAGQLKSEIWQDDFNGQYMPEYEYHAAQFERAAFKQDKGFSKLRCVEENQYQKGQSYVMPKQKLHRIINHGEKLVATMMCSAPTEQGTTRLIPIQHGSDPNIQPPKVTPQHLKQALLVFIDYLDGNTAQEHQNAA